MSRSVPEWVRSVFFFPPSRTRPRLQADIRWWKERLTALSNPEDPNPKHKKAHECGNKLLEVAKELLESDKDTSSLESVLTALRLVAEVRICEIDLLPSENQQIRRDALLADNKERIHGWRADAISRILGEKENDKQNSNEPIQITQEHIKEALRLYNEHEFHLYNRKLIIRDQLKITLASLVSCLLLTIVVIFIMWRSNIFLLNEMLRGDPATAGLEANGSDFWVAVACFMAGGIGACLSSLITMTSAKYDPDVNASRAVTLARPFIGASAGLVVFLFVLAGVLPIGQGAIAAVISVAVAAGFSERFLLGTVAQADPGQQPTTPL